MHSNIANNEKPTQNKQANTISETNQHIKQLNSNTETMKKSTEQTNKHN